MKRFIFTIVILSLLLFTCEGRKSHHESLKQSVAEFKKENDLVKIVYLPEHYQETKIDSTLSNGYTARIKTFTNMKKSRLFIDTKDNILTKTYFRKIEGDVTVEFKNNVVFNRPITNQFIENAIKESRIKLKNYMLDGIWVDQDKSLDKNLLNIDIRYTSLTTQKKYLYFNLQINRMGRYYITVKENPNF
jgi:hypothetical protein